MDEATIQQLLLARHGIRIEPEMGRYVYRKLNGTVTDGKNAAAIPVIGVDARTGVAIRTVIDFTTLPPIAP